MNRRKKIKAPSLGVGGMMLIGGAALVMACSGVYYVYLKNRQIELSRAIDDNRNKVAEYEYDLRGIQSRSDEVLDRYLMRDRLAQYGTHLVEIPLSAIEEVDSIVKPQYSQESKVAQMNRYE